jgi:hypothetical protein
MAAADDDDWGEVRACAISWKIRSPRICCSGALAVSDARAPFSDLNVALDALATGRAIIPFSVRPNGRSKTPA